MTRQQVQITSTGGYPELADDLARDLLRLRVRRAIRRGEPLPKLDPEPEHTPVVVDREI